MAFILKSTKLIPSLVSFASQRGLIGRRKTYFFLQSSSTFDFNLFSLRTATSLAANPSSNANYEEFEKSVSQLTKDIQNRFVQIEDVRNIFDNIKQKGVITYPQLILLLKCCSEVTFMASDKERIELAEEIWKSAADSGTNFHISHYNALLNVFLENNHEFSPMEFLALLESEGVEPNLVTFRRILKAYCQRGNIKAATSTLNKMEEMSYLLNEEDFNSLILGYCEVGDMKKAEEVLRVMQEKDIEPSAKSYTYLLCGYAKHGLIDELKKRLKELPKEDILLAESHLLEIVYTLAANGRMEHVDSILQQLSFDMESGKSSHRIIQRLLHKKLDEEAFQIFDQLQRKLLPPEAVVVGWKNISLHFIKYRRPEEVVNLIEKIETKGWSKSSLGFILKHVFLSRDEQFSLDLLRAMEERGMEVRVHYFWPVILKASEKGNSSMLRILKSLSRSLVGKNFQTVSRIIFPRYRFSDNWRKDLDEFTKLGIRKSILGKCFLEKWLWERKFDHIDEAVTELPFTRAAGIPKTYISVLQQHPNEAKRFVNVLYYLAHDYHFQRSLEKNQSEEWSEETPEEAGGEKAEAEAEEPRADKPFFEFFDSTVLALADRISDEAVVLCILEGMLEKKMGISPETASRVAKTVRNQKIVDAVNKLANPKLKFELSEAVLAKKYERRSLESPKTYSHLTSDVAENVKILSKEMESLETVQERVEFLLQLCQSKRHEEAVKLAESLPKAESEERIYEYLSLVQDLYRKSETDLAEKALNLGMEKGLLNVDTYISLARFFFMRKLPMEAVTMYSIHMEKSKKVLFCSEFFRRAVASGDDAAVKRLVAECCKYASESYCLTHLVLAFVAEGELKKARKVMDSRKITISERLFYYHCSSNINRLPTKAFENFLTFTKDFEAFDRVPLYKLLLKKYALEDDVTGARNLWLSMEEDDISNYNFLEQMREFTNDPTSDSLKKLVKTFEAGTSRSGSPLDPAVSFLKEGKLKDYLDFLKQKVESENFNAIADHFAFGNHLSNVEKDEEALKLYKSLAVECFEKGHITKPLICCISSFITMRNKVSEAEALIKQYADLLKNVPIQELAGASRPFEKFFHDNIISNKELKSRFSRDLPFIYNRLIQLHCTVGSHEKALQCLTAAVEDGCQDKLDPRTLRLLRKLLRATNVEFPYPELLQLRT